MFVGIEKENFKNDINFITQNDYKQKYSKAIHRNTHTQLPQYMYHLSLQFLIEKKKVKP